LTLPQLTDKKYLRKTGGIFSFTGIAVFDLKIAKPNRASRALFKARTALNTTIIINFRQTVNNFNGIRRAIALTNSTTDTADLTIRANRFAVISGGTSDPILSGKWNQMNNVLRARVYAQTASDTFFIFNNGYAVFNLNCTERAHFNARTVSQATVRTFFVSATNTGYGNAIH
jgi:hypothetical protein